LLRNDVRSGGYGEFRLGAGRGHRDILAVFVGTGIGGCVIRDGQLFQGVTHNAGELGHILAKFNGPVCGCGNRGCLEALASRTAITRRIVKAIKRGETTVLKGAVTGKNGRLKSGELAAAVNQGDTVAVREVERAAKVLGKALGGLINLNPPEIILLGGGVTEALGDPFVDRIRFWLHTQAMADPEHIVVIKRAELGDDAGIQGAALFAREKFASVPAVVGNGS
jgi:glucokinase